MAFGGFDALFQYLKEKSWWPRVQPFFVVGTVWFACEVLAYRLIQTEVGLTLPLSLFATSYASIQITVVFLGVVALLLLFKIKRGDTPSAEPGRIARYYHEHRPVILFRLTAIAITTILVGFVIVATTPKKVGQITVLFLDRPNDVKLEAFAYLLYELNRRQSSWDLSLDFEEFNELALSSKQVRQCMDDERPKLCLAIAAAAGRPLIAITGEPLGEAYIAEHRSLVSVISTSDYASMKSLSIYEYLMYNVILQSILIHMDSTGGLPEAAFARRTGSEGGLFEFRPTRSAFKASLLAAKLTPREESLLFNRFGARYMNAARDVLSLAWLHSPRVAGNLKKHFEVDAIDAARPE